MKFDTGSLQPSVSTTTCLPLPSVLHSRYAAASSPFELSMIVLVRDVGFTHSLECILLFLYGKKLCTLPVERRIIQNLFYLTKRRHLLERSEPELFEKVRRGAI